MGLIYARKSPDIQKEICEIVKKYFNHPQKTGLRDTLRDVRRVCSLQNSVQASIVFDDCPVYGGVPVLRNYKQRENYQLLKNNDFWCGYDNTKRNPIWTAYQLSAPENSPLEERLLSFETDLRTRARVTSAEYIGSGFDRGQMAPAHGIASNGDEKIQKDTFLMSNVTPRQHGLNAGIWKDFELLELKKYAPRYQKIWVITGPVFKRNEIHELPSGVLIPAAFYKIYIDETAGRVVVMALLIPQQQAGSEKPEYFLVSVNEIESLTALDFFTDFSEEEQEKIESTTAPRLW